MTHPALVIAIFFCAFTNSSSAQEKVIPVPELNTILMESTFRIHGPSKEANDKVSFGTVFLMGKPIPDTTKAYYVLITAAQVLNEIKGETGTLTLREKHD